jgi:glycosyltransferase involved in cell wall biosynthesis
VSIFNDAAHIVPWTNWVSQSLVDDYGVSPSRITVVPVGVDLKLWKSRTIQTDGPVRFLFVGGDFHRKGGDLLLEAFQQLPKGAAELILVTRESVPEQENVKVYNNLQPNSPELVMLFQESDVFVLPTRAEAYGIVAIEAGASGMPVIMTDIGGVRDIVLDNQNGYLIDVDDVPQLVDRMSRMINDPDLRRQMGRNARERVEKYFDAHKNAARVVDILLGVVAKQVVR